MTILCDNAVNYYIFTSVMVNKLSLKSLKYVFDFYKITGYQIWNIPTGI